MSTAPRLRHQPRPELSLPDVGPQGGLGAALVQRAFGVTLVLASLIAIALVAAVFLVTFDVTVRGTGILEPTRLWPVRARSTGAITEVLVRTGDTVQVGQPLARLDHSSIDVAIDELRAQLGMQRTTRLLAERLAPYEQRTAASAVKEAEARELRARAALRERLVDFGLGKNVDSLLASYVRGSHAGVDAAVADVLSAASEMARAQTQLDQTSLRSLEVARQRWQERQLEAQLRANLESRARTLVLAPGSGVVLADDPERRVGSVMREGDVVIELADTAGWRATVSVRERDVHRIHPGSRALLTIPAVVALRSAPIPGRVVAVARGTTELREAPADNARSSTEVSTRDGPSGYRVVIALDHAVVDSIGPELLRRGYSVEARIVTRRARVIALVREWIRERSAGQ